MDMLGMDSRSLRRGRRSRSSPTGRSAMSRESLTDRLASFPLLEECAGRFLCLHLPRIGSSLQIFVVVDSAGQYYEIRICGNM